MDVCSYDDPALKLSISTYVSRPLSFTYTTKLRCVKGTPLGSPVVPEENKMMATSFQPSTGAASKSSTLPLSVRNSLKLIALVAVSLF